MSYNIITLLSMIICVIISFFISYYLALWILREHHTFFKIAHLVVIIVCITSFYAPIKHILIRYFKLEERETNE